MPLKVEIQGVSNDEYKLFSLLNLNGNIENLQLIKDNGINLNCFKTYADPRWPLLGQRVLFNLANAKIKLSKSWKIKTNFIRVPENPVFSTRTLTQIFLVRFRSGSYIV